MNLKRLRYECVEYISLFQDSNQELIISVSIMTKKKEDKRTVFAFLTGSRHFYLLFSVQTGYEDHWTSEDYFSEDKAAWA